MCFSNLIIWSGWSKCNRRFDARFVDSIVFCSWKKTSKHSILRAVQINLHISSYFFPHHKKSTEKAKKGCCFESKEKHPDLFSNANWNSRESVKRLSSIFFFSTRKTKTNFHIANAENRIKSMLLFAIAKDKINSWWINECRIPYIVHHQDNIEYWEREKKKTIKQFSRFELIFFKNEFSLLSLEFEGTLTISFNVQHSTQTIILSTVHR